MLSKVEISHLVIRSSTTSTFFPFVQCANAVALKATHSCKF